MWFFYAIGFAIITSTYVIIAKKVMRQLDEYQFLWLSGLITIVTQFILLVIFFEIPKINNTFIFSVIISSAINLIAGIASYRAIRISEVSLIAPIAAFNPIFTTLISYFTLKEIIQINDLTGILMVCIGAYFLQISKQSKGLFEPLKSLFKNTGVKLALLAYLLWAITPTFQKVAINNTQPAVPLFASFAGMIVTILFLSPFVLKFSKFSKLKLKNNLNLLIIGAILAAVGQMFAFTAFNLTSLGLATAVFKLDMLFTIFFVWLFFKEKNIKDKFVGALIMLVGTFLILM